MNKEEIVNSLIKSTISRAIRESVACVIVLIVFAYQLQGIQPGTAEYFGCLLILVSTGFIGGVIWSFALSYRLLRTHPVTDSVFWSEALTVQARLLRMVPLWYLAPLFSGLVLMAAPTGPGEFGSFMIQVGGTVLLFGAVAWLNRTAAAGLDEQAEMMKA